MLSEVEQAFLDRRRRLARSWTPVAVLLLLTLAALLAWLLSVTPLLVNPWQVVERLEAGTIERPSLELMAVLLPVVVAVSFCIMAAVIGFGFAVFRNERRYLAIIDRLADQRASSRPTGQKRYGAGD